MNDAVLDASAYVAWLSPGERHFATARTLLARVPAKRPFTVPSLFRVEVLSALARRSESVEFIDAVDARLRGPRFRYVPLDDRLLERATLVARGAGLRAYDAVYCAVAVELGLPLMTLDAEVGPRLLALYPDAVVLPG